MHSIVRLVDNVIIEFSRNVKGKDKTIRADLVEILNSKSWTDTMAFHYQIYGVRIRYIDTISRTGEQVRKSVMELIQLYKEYLTEKQIMDLESIAESSIFSIASDFSSININLDAPKGKKCLIDMFCDMYDKLLLIEKTFD